MSSKIIPRCGVSAVAISRLTHRPSPCPSQVQSLLRPLAASSNSVHSSTHNIDEDATITQQPPISPSHNSSSSSKATQRSPFPVIPPIYRPPFSKPAHSPQYDPSRAPTSPPTPLTGTLERPQLSQHLRDTLPLLAAQTPHYATIHIHGKPYLVTAGDTLRLPFLMHGVAPGDVLRLNRATILGSREWTLQGGTIAGNPTLGVQETGEALSSSPLVDTDTELIVGKTEGLETSAYPGSSNERMPEVGRTAGLRKKGPAAYVDERLFTIRAVVLGTESEPLRIKEKKKQRNRRTKTVKSKHRFTVLRISELEVNGGDIGGFEGV